jgi:hypothetical protein
LILKRRITRPLTCDNANNYRHVGRLSRGILDMAEGVCAT